VLEEHEAEKQDEGDQEDDLEKECGKIQKAYSVPIIVSKGDQMIVYGVVSEPEVVDLQGDRLSESEIRKACHRFMQLARRFAKSILNLPKLASLRAILLLRPLSAMASRSAREVGLWP